MGELWHLLYRSEMAHDMSPQEMVDLLHKARAFNAEHAITGLLLRCGHCFMQLIEGEREQVHTLYRMIERDPRHAALIVQVDCAAAARLFPSWQMGYDEAHRLNGHAALFSIESEREARHHLRMLAEQHGFVRRMEWFLEGTIGV